MIKPETADTNAKRPSINETPLPHGCSSFILGERNKSYKQQFSNLYFARLHFLKPHVQKRAAIRWQNVQGKASLVDRVLEVEKGKLCYIIGTVYIDMPSKPNILDDIALDKSVPAPPKPEKYCSDKDATYLEDESGRIRIVGEALEGATLVTGLIISVLGMENDQGEFTVIDICHCGLSPQPLSLKEDPEEMQVDSDETSGEWIALVSGLNVGARPPIQRHEIRLQLLVEYLSSELSPSSSESTSITRLIIAGDSLTPIELRDEMESLINPRAEKNKPRAILNDGLPPNELLAGYLLDIGRSMPIHIMPGQKDPSAITLPQQPLPRAMLGPVQKMKSTFKCETNPTWLSFEGCNILGTSGQPLNDMSRYLPDPDPAAEESKGKEVTDSTVSSLRLRLLQTSHHSRHIAPTAPDTLHCFPYLTGDPFILNITPHLLFHGNQPRFETALIEENEIKCRLLCLPKFSETGQLVLFNTRTLAVQLVELDAEGFDVHMSE